MHLIIRLLCFLWATAPAFAQSSEDVDPDIQNGLKVTTSTGKVSGIMNGTTPNVHTWLGIPYAQPPVGHLRWAPPAPLPKSNKSIAATHMPNACMQSTSIGDGIYGFLTRGQYLISTPVSEDCLTLSVWAPAARRERLPVVIFIHGGGLSSGGESVQYQIPAKWVERSQSHIVVSIQYRLGVFGFPSSHALRDTSQNFGLLDQRLAIEWVRDNIAAFGGNPEQNTLWGQSAGAALIDWYNFAYADDPIAKGLIMDSGSVWLFGSMGNDSSSSFPKVTSHFNCTGSDVAQSACMRNQSATSIQGFIESPAGSELSFVPTQDNITVFSDYTALYQRKQYADVPAIYGTNLDEESSIFMCPQAQGLRQRLPSNRLAFFYQYHGNFSNISPDPTVGAYHSAELPLIMGTYGNVNGRGTEFQAFTSEKMQDLWVTFVRDPANGLPKNGWRSLNDGFAEILGNTTTEVAARNIPIDDVPGWAACPKDIRHFSVGGTIIQR